MAFVKMKPPAGVTVGLGADGKQYYLDSRGFANVDSGSVTKLTNEGWSSVTDVAPGAVLDTVKSQVDQVTGVIKVSGGTVGDTEFKNHALQPVAFIDFATKPDGAPPAKLDTDQAVDYHFNATGREPVIKNGRLVVSNQAAAGSGGLADYYQAAMGEPVTRIGVEFTMPAGADDGHGNMCYAAWDGVYEGSGAPVPRSWVHMVIIPGTGTIGTAKFFVCNGIGNLFVVKEQTFTNPAADGVTPWFCESILDAEVGIAYSFLPDGSLMTVTDAEIAAMCTTLSISTFKFADLESKWIMCEHYCSTGASAAKFPEYKALFGETVNSEAKRFKTRAITKRIAASIVSYLTSLIPASPVSAVVAPTTALSLATTTSAANIDGTNGKVTAKAGPTGKVIIIATAYYEWSANDTLFWRFAGNAVSPTRAAHVGVTGSKGMVTQTIEISGLTPGQSITETLQHWTSVAGSATCKAGGSGGGMVPPFTLAAFPA